MSLSEYFFKEGCFITELLNKPTDNAVSVARVRVAPGETTHWHYLKNTTERYLILEGAGRAETDHNGCTELRPGDSLFIPEGCHQRITNTGKEDLIFLAVCTPRFEESNYVEDHP